MMLVGTGGEKYSKGVGIRILELSPSSTTTLVLYQSGAVSASVAQI